MTGRIVEPTAAPIGQDEKGSGRHPLRDARDPEGHAGAQSVTVVWVGRCSRSPALGRAGGFDPASPSVSRRSSGSPWTNSTTAPAGWASGPTPRRCSLCTWAAGLRLRGPRAARTRRAPPPALPVAAPAPPAQASDRHARLMRGHRPARRTSMRPTHDASPTSTTAAVHHRRVDGAAQRCAGADETTQW